MKTIKLTILTLTLILTACKSSKKSTTTSVASVPVATATTTANSVTGSPPFTVGRSADGIYPPGNAELTAIQVAFKEETLDKLTEGYTIYTKGACINCHGAKNIYQHSMAEWKELVDDMSARAYLSPIQKDAVYKYVVSIKAVQGK
jgi:hypothetical protein